MHHAGSSWASGYSSSGNEHHSNHSSQTLTTRMLHLATMMLRSRGITLQRTAERCLLVCVPLGMPPAEN